MPAGRMAARASATSRLSRPQPTATTVGFFLSCPPAPVRGGLAGACVHSRIYGECGCSALLLDAGSFPFRSKRPHKARRKLVPDAQSGMPMWQDRLFIGLANLATDPSDYFRLPTNRVVELGSHVVI